LERDKTHKTESGNFSIQFKNQKYSIFHNIEAWRKNIVTEQSNQSEDKQAIGEEKQFLPKSAPSMDKDKTNTSVSLNFENSITHVPTKKINSEFAQTFSLSCTPRNEFTEVLNALHQLSVRHARVCPADRLPSVWTKSTAIVAKTDHDRPGQYWVAFLFR